MAQEAFVSDPQIDAQKANAFLVVIPSDADSEDEPQVWPVVYDEPVRLGSFDFRIVASDMGPIPPDAAGAFDIVVCGQGDNVVAYAIDDRIVAVFSNMEAARGWAHAAPDLLEAGLPVPGAPAAT